MRSPHGYGGPVVHWWRDCLYYTGPGLDWRYEGIVLGYLHIFRATGDAYWIERARSAGDDLLEGQSQSGNLLASSFEANPLTGGTPHEAACMIALITLATALQSCGVSDWGRYAEGAERGIRGYLLGSVWNGRQFCNQPDDSLFVANKAATTAEALMAWADLSGDQSLIARYVIPTLDQILTQQIHAPGMVSDGAIIQSDHEHRRRSRIFPLYVARCVPALLMGYQHSGHISYLRAAQAAVDFLLRVGNPDGSFPQLIYSHGAVQREPCWVAGAGDILRAIRLIRPEVVDIQERVIRWILNGRTTTGGIRSAVGFSNRQHTTPDVRDLIPVCGWVDKAFRALSMLIEPGSLPTLECLGKTELPCLFGGHKAVLFEDRQTLEIRRGSRVVYRWVKGNTWVNYVATY
jgi:hypothetical protein